MKSPEEAVKKSAESLPARYFFLAIALIIAGVFLHGNWLRAKTEAAKAEIELRRDAMLAEQETERIRIIAEIYQHAVVPSPDCESKDTRY